jgi:hypothetical protein
MSVHSRFKEQLVRKLFLLLFLVPCLAWGQNWQFVTKNADGISFYVDRSSIRRNGHLVRFWELVDFVPGDSSQGSIRSLSEIDCRENRTKSLDTTAFSGQMASGRILSREDDRTSRWDPIPPGTAVEITMRFVCDQKR